MTKFTIRDVLLVTVIVALAVGWLVDRYRGDKSAGLLPTTPTPDYELVVTGTNHDKLLLYDMHTGAVWESNRGQWLIHTEALKR
jgi:hypothetical protein